MQHKHLIMIRIAGGICLFFMFFHLAFYKLFNWDTSLNSLTLNNRSILLTYHYISILITGFMGILPFIQGKALLKSPLKYSVLGFFSLFYFIRIVTEFTHFGFNLPQSPVIIVLCVIPMVLFAIPIFSKNK